MLARGGQKIKAHKQQYSSESATRVHFEKSEITVFIAT